MGIVAWRPVDEHYLHAAALQLLQHHHLVHEVAGQPVRRGDQHHVKGRPRRLVAQRVQAGAVQLGAAVAVVAEDVLGGDRPSVVGGDIGPQLGDLLLDGLGLLLAVGGHAHIQRHSHRRLLPALPPTSPPSATPAGRPGPTGPAHPAARWSPAGPRRCAAWPPSRCWLSSLGRATPADPPAAAAAAATTPAEAGRSGSSRTCHLRSNHRAHHPVL
jgi:hypothetical protein